MALEDSDNLRSNADAIPLPQYCHYPTWPLPFDFDIPETDLHDCPYLPDRKRRDRAFLCKAVPSYLYQRLMDAGFRRSGEVFYQPECPTCRACVPIRVPVQNFTPSNSQKKTLRKNRDLTVSVHHPEPGPADGEKFALYRAYCEERHSNRESPSYESFVDFLYTSPTDTLEFQTRNINGDLIAVGIADLTPEALSTVYFYFAPTLDNNKRSLGTWSSLWEIQFARDNGLHYYYLGFTIAELSNMAYKIRFKPYEYLGADGIWRPASSDTFHNTSVE